MGWGGCEGSDLVKGLRTWRAWYAHITLSMLALAWLAASRAQADPSQNVAGGALEPERRHYLAHRCVLLS
jgi:SRSO17 transposase